jgi:uncharacterized membrane protein
VTARLRERWQAARESLWLLPSGLTLFGALLAFGMVRLDRELGLDQRHDRFWAFSGGASGARGVLQAIAGSLITVTATVFSITVVTLQLASTQFTPRVLRTFMRDRGVQLVFGVFIGTFTYALLVLRAVRSQADDDARFVPSLSVLGAIVLALTCVGFLIYIVHHVAQMIRVPSVVERVTRDGERLIDRWFPDGIGEPLPAVDAGAPEGPARVVTASTDGYLHGIAADALFALSEDRRLTIRIERLIGDFVLAGEALASVWPAEGCTEEVAAAIRQHCALGPEPTLVVDVQLPIRQLADIAVKALSPGVNDPTTAAVCIDHLGRLLVRAARRGEPPRAYRRKDSAVTLVVPAVSFEALVTTAFTQIRHFGMGDAVIAAHLLALLERMIALVPPACRQPLASQAELARAGATARMGRTSAADGHVLR